MTVSPSLFSAKLTTTAQQLGSIIKSARDLMRKDKGLNGDLDRLPMLTWIMFLKFLDDMEQEREVESEIEGVPYRPLLEEPYRWRDWAANSSILSGDELIAFINQDEAMRPDGVRGAGLFAYLRKLQSSGSGDARRDVVATVFKGVLNRMTSGYLLREVIDKVNDIHFTSSDEMSTLGRLYESLLKEMRDAAGDAGEFYTPRPLVRFIVQVMNPRLGEVVLDPACGTGGFLTEAFDYLKPQVQTLEDRVILQKDSIKGGEAKPLPYLLAQMSLLLHGLESPQIDPGNSLRFRLAEIGDRDRVDVLLTNPPFGGEEERSIMSNFPHDKQTAETALLFLQVIMRRLRREPRPGRAAVVIPDGTLFGDGIAARIKQELLSEFNLHTILRLPRGVFEPYTSIASNVLFFDRSGPTREIWFYEHPLPTGRKNYTKTQPLQFEQFAPCIAWWNERSETDQVWRVDWETKHCDAVERAQPHWDEATRLEAEARASAYRARELSEEIARLRHNVGLLATPAATQRLKDAESERARDLSDETEQRQRAKEEQTQGDAIYWPIFNLDIKNPRTALDIEHLPPQQLVESILSKEHRIAHIMGELRDLLAETTQ